MWSVGNTGYHELHASLTNAINGKTKLSTGLAQGQSLIAKGEIDLGLFNLSEIPRAPGVVRAGSVPAPVQVYINYDSAVPITNTAPEPPLRSSNIWCGRHRGLSGRRPGWRS